MHIKNEEAKCRCRRFCCCRGITVYLTAAQDAARDENALLTRLPDPDTAANAGVQNENAGGAPAGDGLEQALSPAGPAESAPPRPPEAVQRGECPAAPGDAVREETKRPDPRDAANPVAPAAGGLLRGENRRSDAEGFGGRGLLFYRKWWERSEADIFVGGDRLTGIPIFTDRNTLRVVNGTYSYFIPLEKVDYIRTTDGLLSRGPVRGGLV